MSPILVRPVREQFEHDRVIRVLQARYKRKYEVVINPGAEQNASVAVGDVPMFPDLVLFSLERGRKILGTVEVETGESVNMLEAMAEWGPFSRLRAPFYLYVPVNSIDTVRRLCTEHRIAPAEIWTYHAAIDQVRFTMVHRAPEAAPAAEPRVAAPKTAATREAPPRPRAEKGKAAKKGAPARPARSSRAGASKKSPAPRAAAARTGAAKKAVRKTVARKPIKTKRR